MAETTAAQAIEVLHNNQYQKHIGNGEYDYIHPLTDAEAKLIEKLIKQQSAEIAKKDRMLERATWVLDRTGTCPKTCDLMRNLCAARACWLAWLEKEAEEQG